MSRDKSKPAPKQIRDILPEEKPYVNLKQTKTGVAFDIASEERITTPAQLLKYIGYDARFWEIERMIANKWEVAAFGKKREEFVLQDLWQVKGYLKPIKGAEALKALGDAIIAEIKKYSPIVKLAKRKSYDDPCLCEVDLFDAHFGKLVWGDETGGGHYDVKIAEKRYLEAIQKMIDRIKPYNIEKILFPISNDFFNVDGSSMETFNGTPQHEDQRWEKTFRAGMSVLRKSIEMLSEIAVVDVIVVPGNHDASSSFYAGEVLSAVYEKNKNVSVDNAPTQRKYYRYGKCLIGFTHGKYEKHGELPLIMASERSQDFGETRFREWHIGHYHHKKEYQFLSAQEFKGVVVRILRALTEVDAWHASRGYIGSLTAAEAFVWNKESGLICNLSVNI